MACNYAHCQSPVSQPRLCPGCKKRSYCSQQCRLADWYSGHQLNCGLEHPTTPGKFRLEDFQDEEQKIKVLGKGSYGEVKLVIHLPTREKYALKVLSKSQFQRESSLQVLKREITLHSTLDHPHIIKLYDHLEDDNNVYLVLEYANRGSLFHEVHRQKKLTEDKARNFFKQTCEAVQYLHENDIIHRDIKPENILLDSLGTIKLCDFGWCARGNEARTTFCGTLDYMAPEMVMGSGHSFSIDTWALGVLLFEMTHGRAPFTAKKEKEKCQQILKLAYTVDPSLSPELKDLISLILKSAPDDRLPVDKILSHPWIKGLPLTVKEEPLVGVSLKNYVKGYGIAEGVVTAVEGDTCAIFYQTPNVTEKLAMSKVMKIVKRKNTVAKGGNVFGEVKEVEVRPVPAVYEEEAKVPEAQVEEDALLEKIEKWCKAPSKVPVKADKFLQELEETNKKLEDSLTELHKKKEEPSDLPCEKVVLDPPTKLEFPHFPPLSADEPIDSSSLSDSASIQPAQIVLETEPTPNTDTINSGRGFDVFSPIEVVTTEPEFGLASPKFGIAKEVMEEIGVVIEEMKEQVRELTDERKEKVRVITGDRQKQAAIFEEERKEAFGEKPEFNELEKKELFTESSGKEERDTANFIPLELQSKPAEMPHDFESERQKIEEKHWLFYNQTQTKWTDNQQSKPSIVPAPSFTSAPDSDMPSPYVEELEPLAIIPKRDIDAKEVKSADIGRSTTALTKRKQQLEVLLKQIQNMPALPRLRRPEPPREKKSTFLQWLGGVMGCGNR